MQAKPFCGHNDHAKSNTGRTNDRTAKRKAARPTKPMEEVYRPKAKAIELIPRGPNQARYIDLLHDEGRDIIFATGPAGTGKTHLPSLYAIRELKDGGYKKIIITRPVIPNGEELGFLPGDLNEKLAPWMIPVTDSFTKAGISKPEFESLIAKGIVELASLEHMRGRNLDNCFVIADEMQNATSSQLKMLITRIGEGTRMAITGDLDQRDRKDSECGLLDFLARMDKAPRSRTQRFGRIEFDVNDVVRHAVIADVLFLYDL